MKTLHLKLVLGLATLALAAAALGLGASGDTLARKVNEYEGQHRVGQAHEDQHDSVTGDPSQWG